MQGAYHIFRDPIHGFIKVYDVERDIINSIPFQRLRCIHQLGLTHYIYHGAEHTRFGHSLGVMNFASKIFDSIYDRYGDVIREKLDWGNDDFRINREKLRIAALLHDIGHSPFSHASEDLFPKSKGGKKQDHTVYSERIVAETRIKAIIDAHTKSTGVSSGSVINILNKKTLGNTDNFLKQIYDGELDADRMDYLIRDSLFAGVEYGRFDFDRIIETLGVFEKDDGSLSLGIEERGKHAAEGLILARYFMFLQVYFHNIRRIYDIHLLNLIKEILHAEIKADTYPSEIDAYLTWDDIKILNYAKVDSSKKTSENVNRIINRQHFIMLDETSDHAQGGEIENFKSRVNKLKKQIGDQNIIEDTSLNAPYQFQYRRGEEKLCVIPKRHGRPKDIAIASRLVDSLQEIYKLRVYVHPSYEDKALPLL